VIITIKSMFCHSMQCPLYCSNFPELKQSKQSSFRCLLCNRAWHQAKLCQCKLGLRPDFKKLPTFLLISKCNLCWRKTFSYKKIRNDGYQNKVEHWAKSGRRGQEPTINGVGHTEVLQSGNDKPGNPYWRERLCTIHLLDLVRSDQPILILKIFSPCFTS
jgi:hypothetical protein